MGITDTLFKMCLITINLGTNLQTMIGNRPTKAFEPGKYQKCVPQNPVDRISPSYM